MFILSKGVKSENSTKTELKLDFKLKKINFSTLPGKTSKIQI